jgi:hypothetical protein
LTISGSGVLMGVIAPLASRSLTTLDGDLAGRLKEHLRSSSFVTVAIADAPDATILVEEEGAQDKPSLLTTLTPDEILRFWSLLTEAQKQEFFEAHVGQLDDELVARLGTGTIRGNDKASSTRLRTSTCRLATSSAPFAMHFRREGAKKPSTACLARSSTR